MYDINAIPDSSQLEDIQKTLKEMARTTSPLKGWYNEVQTQKILGLKTTALWSLRKLNQIKSSKIGGKTFYSIDSIIRLLDKNSR
jgi:hypothetical protein